MGRAAMNARSFVDPVQPVIAPGVLLEWSTLRSDPPDHNSPFT